MAYDPKIIAAIEQRAAQIKDPRTRDRFRRAAGQIAIVESGVQNLDYGDADSKNYRQERESVYGSQWAKTGGPLNTAAITDRLFNELAQFDHGQPSWELAADVQRPAAQYRGRYKDVAKQAASLFGGASSPAASGSTPTAATGSSGSGQAAAPVLGDPGRAGDVTGLLQSLISKPQPVAQAQAVAPPMFSARPSLPQGVQLAAPQTSQAPERSGGVEGALSLLQTLGGTDPASAAPSAADATGGPQEPVVATVRRQRADAKAAGGLVPLGGSQNAGKGAFTISGPDPGRLQKGLTTFADQVASIYGGTLEGLDGSTHNKFVKGTTRVSEHYSGNATDIFKIDGKPATGLRLMRAGRAALIAAGMPREKALKAPGGLYNVTDGNGVRHQIIFGVSGQQYGGDHTDHLHISSAA